MAHSSVKSAILFETIYQGFEPQPLIDFLKISAGISGRSLSKYFFRGLVFVNSRKAHSSAKINPGDSIKVLAPREEQSLRPQEMPLDIVFENQDLLVVNKPAQMAVHPVKNITEGTLSHGIAAYFEKSGVRAKVRPVNRLDFGTSGLIIFAKNAQIQNEVSRAIQQHAIQRVYFAVVQGFPATETGLIDLPIGDCNGKRRVTVNGQPSQTLYRVIQKFAHHTHLELQLLTGRTHQIRVHLNHLGLPIVGDRQYGIESPEIKRPALHAGKLDFNGSPFKIPVLTAPFPADFTQLLDKLKNRQS